jgi:tRNA pseudouridine55 synthase
VEDAVDPQTLSAETIPSLLRPAAQALSSLPRVELSEEQMADVVQGRAIVVDANPAGEVAMFGPEGRLVGIGEAEGGRLKPRRVLATG